MKFSLRHLQINLKLFFNNAVSFLKTKIELRAFIIIASLAVGVLSGLAAVVLKDLVHFLQKEPQKFFTDHGLNYLLPFTPVAGIVISVLIVNIFFGGKITKGIGNIIYLIIRHKSDVPKRKLISHLLTSGVTVGMGGSAGLEAPIVITGAAIGSNFAKGLKFNYQTRTLLLASGSAAGISAIFNSPIAGVIFAFEVLLPELSVSSFIPLLIASASAAVVSKFLYSGQLFYLVTEGWHLEAIPFYILLGFLSGFISLYIIKTTFHLEDLFDKFRRPYLKAVFGGMILCGLIFLIPPLFGEGYLTVESLLSGNYQKILENSIFSGLLNKELALVISAAVIILAKPVATSLTLSSGGNGGIIAPSLFTGAVLGFLLSFFAGYSGLAPLNISNFIVVGMAGILSGVLHSPLTGIFLIAEITGGYALIVPLMIVTAISFFISKYFHPHSIYTWTLAKRGIKFRSEKEKYAIRRLSIEELIENDFLTVKPNTTLRELVEKITKTKRNLFPVLNEDGILMGVVTLDDVREVMLNTDLHNIILLYEIMNNQFESIDIQTDITAVLEIFEEKQIWNLAVTDKGIYRGFISKSNVFNSYIANLAKEQQEMI